MPKLLLLAVAATLAVLTGVTLVALEGGEVVVLRTADANGGVHDTRTWVADDDGATWIEAANPERPFLHRLASHPEVELRRAHAWHRCHAEVVENPAGHRRVRELLAAKYGWKDRWIGLLTDTSGSVAVRLACE